MTMAVTIADHGIVADTQRGAVALRSVLFAAAFLFLWLTVTPFPDLSQVNLMEEIGAGNPLNQALATLTTILLGLFVWRMAPEQFRTLINVPLVLMLAWFAISAVFSPNDDLAIRRLVLGVFTMFNAAALLIVPKDRVHFAWLLFGCGLFVILLSFAGVVLLPDRAIHQVGDMLDDTLAGDWRGALEHKNRAGGAMVILIFVGLYVREVASRPAGYVLMGAAAVFLFFTHAKSSIGLLPVTLLLAALVGDRRNLWGLLLAAVAVPFAINLATVGSVMFEPVRDALNLVIDATFTNRADLWNLSLRFVAERPLLGYGFQAFWQTPVILNQADLSETWAYMGPDAHNAYLNVVLMMGAVGLALSLVWLIALPLRDALATAEANDPMRRMFVRIWLFGLYLSGSESIFFGNGNCIWLMLLMSVIGLSFLAAERRAQA